MEIKQSYDYFATSQLTHKEHKPFPEIGLSASNCINQKHTVAMILIILVATISSE